MTYHLWITLVSTTFEADIVRGLIKRGWEVEAASGSFMSLTFENGPSPVLALKIARPEDIIPNEVYSDCYTILNGIGAKYYSIVVSEYSEKAMWNTANFSRGDSLEEKIDKKPN